MQLKYTYNSVSPGLQHRAPLPVYYHDANLKGYQGQEKDDEIKGAGNSVNYTYRMHDPRLGRFFAIDPLTRKYPNYSPYSFSGNKVIHCRELEGLEEVPVNPNGETWTPEEQKKQEQLQEEMIRNMPLPELPDFDNVDHSQPPTIQPSPETPMYNENGFPTTCVLHYTMAPDFATNVYQVINDQSNYIASAPDPQLALTNLVLYANVDENPQRVEELRGPDAQSYIGRTWFVTTQLCDSRNATTDNPDGAIVGTWQQFSGIRYPPQTSSVGNPGFGLCGEGALYLQIDENISIKYVVEIIIILGN